MRTIKEGDKVLVTFMLPGGLSQLEGIVNSIPQDVGDLWYIEVTYPETENKVVAINPTCSGLMSITKIVEKI